MRYLRYFSYHQIDCFTNEQMTCLSWTSHCLWIAETCWTYHLIVCQRTNFVDELEYCWTNCLSSHSLFFTSEELTFVIEPKTVTGLSCALTQSTMISYHRNALSSLGDQNIRPCFALFLLQEVNKPLEESPFLGKNLLPFRSDPNPLSQLSCWRYLNQDRFWLIKEVFPLYVYHRC